MAIAIELKNVSKIFEQGTKDEFHAVSSLDITINEGQIFGFLGPNGAGKTTILKMICGLIRQTEGSIRLNGFDVNTDRYNAMHQIGVVLEGARNIYWQLSPLENLLYYGRLKGYFGKELYNRAVMLLHDLELWDCRFDIVGDFSRGTQQKVAIACALVANPSIILFDEPTLGLDVQAARIVKNWIIKLAQEQGRTIVITTHQLDIAEQLCDRVAMIHKGRLISQKPIHEYLNLFKQESYQIKVEGLLSGEQAHLFCQSGFTINKHHDNTVFLGTFSNSQEFYSVLEKIKAHGLSLVSAAKVATNLEDVFVQLINQH